MTTRPTEILRTLVSLGLFLASSFLMIGLILDLNTIKTYEADVAEINNVRYGMLDADLWVERISEILEHRIADFELTDQNRPEVKRNIERVLDRLIIEVGVYLRNRNAQGDSWWERVQGKLQQGVQDWLVDFDEIRQQVPEYADAMLDELSKPEVKQDITAQVLRLIREAADATFTKTDRSALELVLLRHRCQEPVACSDILATAIDLGTDRARIKAGIVLALVALLFAVNLIRNPGLSHGKMTLLTMSTLILLVGGVWTPMIEIEAKISQLSFQLLGEPVVFENQVLYFQSKSIVDVVFLLMETGAYDMILVGFLISMFSIVFPAAKIVSSFLFHYDVKGLRESWLVRFFALKSGKWSMADVMVVSIFMAFVGFSGLVSSQLSNIAGAGKAVEVLTTNGTSLQIGFYLFLAFCIAGLVVSTVLESDAERQQQAEKPDPDTT